MKKSRHREIPLWLLLMPSVAVGLLLFGMDTPQSALEEHAAVAAPPRSAMQRPVPQRAATPRATPKATAKVTPRATPKSTFKTAAARAKFEPARGAYLGAALDMSSLSGANLRGQIAAQMQSWERESGRDHALYMQFIPFPHGDGSFPTWERDPQGWASAAEFSSAAASLNATPILTLEPLSRPEQFSRDWLPDEAAYKATQAFAQAVGRWKRPVFIRFAHEMNGSWYPWAEWTDKNRNMQRDPGEETGFTAADYRAAYRNVAMLFRRYAPNAALVWCPNSGLLGGGRRDVFRPFWPGDDVVDWVGLDIYERGWTMPMPGAKLWAGQFAHNLTRDAADDPNTEPNESVDFYKTFVEGKKKPLMICETAATLSYRTDLSAEQRAEINHQWKMGYWNQHEYGWMRSVYGTTLSGENLLHPIDKDFPGLKAIVWFQVAKRETIPVERTVNGQRDFVWFDNVWTDYRLGGGTEENGARPYQKQEIDLYRRLTANSYFLSRVQP